MIKRIAALLIALVLCLPAFCQAVTVPSPVYKFYEACKTRGVTFYATDDMKIDLEGNPRFVEIRAKEFNFNYYDYGKDGGFVIMAFYQNEMWAIICALSIFGGMSERDAYIAYYDIALANETDEEIVMQFDNVEVKYQKNNPLCAIVTLNF